MSDDSRLSRNWVSFREHCYTELCTRPCDQSWNSVHPLKILCACIAGNFNIETSKILSVMSGLCFFRGLTALKWRSFVQQDIQQQLHFSTTVCVCVCTCVYVCPVSVSMQGCNCSISGMLVEFRDLNNGCRELTWSLLEYVEMLCIFVVWSCPIVSLTVHLDGLYELVHAGCCLSLKGSCQIITIARKMHVTWYLFYLEG